MNQERNQLKRLLRQLALLRIVLAASLIAALAATTLVLFLPFTATSGPAVPVAESNNVTGTATTFFSSTPSAAGQGGYVVLQPGLPVPNLLGYSAYTALISWTVFGSALIWRGHVRSVWGKSRFSYDTFRLLVKMRGAQTRLKLMRSLNPPKNKLQMATALGIDWKAVDKHVQVLEKNGLLHATTTSGTATFYEVTEKGRSVIELLEQLGADVTMQD